MRMLALSFVMLLATSACAQPFSFVLFRGERSANQTKLEFSKFSSSIAVNPGVSESPNPSSASNTTTDGKVYHNAQPSLPYARCDNMHTYDGRGKCKKTY